MGSDYIQSMLGSIYRHLVMYSGQCIELILCTSSLPLSCLLFLPRLETIPHKVSPNETSKLLSSDERSNFVWGNNLSHTKYHPLSGDCIIVPDLFDQAYVYI